MCSEEAIRIFVEYQRALCQAFCEAYPVSDHDFLTDAPKHGSISAADKYWEFTRHGKGLRFETVPSGVVIDVTEGVFTGSEFFDAWRLGEYLESISVKALTFDGKRFDAENLRELEQLLQFMISRNLLTKHPERSEWVSCLS